LCLSPTPTFQPITIPIRLNLDPISSRICSASAVEHPDPQLLTPSQDITPSGLASIQLSRIFPTPLWVPHQKKGEREKERKKKNQARQRQAKRRHSQSEYSTGSSLSSPSIYLLLGTKAQSQPSHPFVAISLASSTVPRPHFPSTLTDTSPGQPHPWISPTKCDPQKYHSPAPKGSQRGTIEGFSSRPVSTDDKRILSAPCPSNLTA